MKTELRVFKLIGPGVVFDQFTIATQVIGADRTWKTLTAGAPVGTGFTYCMLSTYVTGPEYDAVTNALRKHYATLESVLSTIEELDHALNL